MSRKQLSLVFTGDEFADGGELIRQVLKSENVQAAFFLTGRFYGNPQFKQLIGGLKKDGHYLGAHSDAHLLYCDWAKRDSMLLSNDEFKQDLHANYEKMEQFGIRETDAPYFLPPYEWYNATIVNWTMAEDLRLINFSPGTRSAADYTFPEMGAAYRSSEEIYKSIITLEEQDPHGLNGFILLSHIGTDPRRKDKFYSKLKGLIVELKSRGYQFKKVDELLKD